MPDQCIKPGFLAGIALAAGVAAVSMGAIFTRYAQKEASSLTIAAYRMGFAFAVVLIPAMLRHRQELRSLSARDTGLSALAGLFLAVHFSAWIYSLKLTSVAVSVVLVNTAPLWVGLLTPLLFRERVSRNTVFGIAMAVLGAVVIGCGIEGSQSSPNHLYGGVLAVIGALGLAFYLLIGRSVRRRHSLLVYIAVCYGTAAGYLALAAVCTAQQVTGFSPSTWLSLMLLAVVCQVFGHSVNNWALKLFSASMIAVALLGEPICATLLAWTLFGEALTWMQAGGALLILTGIVLAAKSEVKVKALTVKGELLP